MVSRRIAKPFPGKSDMVLSRVTRFRDLVIKAGAKARAAKFVGGSLNGSGNTSQNRWYDTSGNVNWEIQKCN